MRCKYRVRRACARVCLGVFLVLYSPYGLVADQSSGSTRRKPATETFSPQERAPLQDAGETQHFRYEREQDSMYRVIPTNGSASYVVSESFLRTTLRNTQIDNQQQAELLRTYPGLVQEMFAQTLANAYPDATVMYEVPFEPYLLETPDGTQTALEQDPLASPYVRVKLTNNDGQTREFSVARDVVAQLLEDPRLTDAQFLQGLQSFPFRLPEVARTAGFARLSRPDLAALVQQEPALQRYDFIRLAKPDTEGTDPRPPYRRIRQVKQDDNDATLQSGASTVPQSLPPNAQPTRSVGTSETNMPRYPHPIAKDSQSTRRTQQANLSQKSLTPEKDSAAGVSSGLSQATLYIVGLSFLTVGIVILLASRAPRR